MPQSLALPQLGFIPTSVSYHTPTEASNYAQSVSPSAQLCRLPAPRLRFADTTVSRALRHSAFTVIGPRESLSYGDGGTQPSVKADAPFRRAIHASARKQNPRSASPKQKLFLVHFAWIISEALSALHPRTADEPRLLRKCAAVLFNFLKAYTAKNPVAVVLPNHKELTLLISQSHNRKLSNRETTDAVLSAQFLPALNKICRALGVSVYMDKLHESRDTIGRLAGSQRENSISVVIVSSDSDFMQLLRHGQVTILKPYTNARFEEISEELFVHAMHGLHPRQYVDLLALIGRKGKTKGIPEINREFAALLISRFGCIEDLIPVARDVVRAERSPRRRKSMELLRSATREFVSPRIARGLLRGEKRLIRAKQMLSLVQDKDYRVQIANLQRKPASPSRVTKVLRSFENHYRKKISSNVTKAVNRVPLKQQHELEKSEYNSASGMKKVVLIDTQHHHQGVPKRALLEPAVKLPKPDIMISEAKPSKQGLKDRISKIGSSIEILPIFELTQNGHVLNGVAYGDGKGNAVYVDLRSSKRVPKVLADVLESNSVEKHGCFLRELYKYLLTEHNITMDGTLFDAHIALDLLGMREKQIRELVAALGESSRLGMYEMLLDRSKTVLGCSRDRVASLFGVLTPMIADLRVRLEQKGLLQIALRVEFPLIRVLGSMEITGVPIVRSELEHLKTSYEARLSKIEDDIGDLRSARALMSMTRKASSGNLFDACFGLHLNPSAASKQIAKPTASRLELETMALDNTLPHDHRALANLYVQYEDISKFLERDVIPLARHIQNDGRIRATFVQGDGATGRLATREPNLQTIPARSQLGRELRSTFRAPDGMRVLCADYNQIELRIVASLCGDSFMLDAFSSGTDIHRCIAAKIFDVPITDVTNTQRNQAKQVIYSILYGVSSTGLGEQLELSVREAENLMSEFKIEFPVVQELTRQLVDEASRTGYAKTLLGRRLPLPMLARGSPAQRRAASRKAVNMPIQGTQADMIKLSMIRIHERLRTIGATSSLVLQIHDELVLEVAECELEEVTSIVEEEMISALPLTGVDISVRVSCGPSWCKHD